MSSVLDNMLRTMSTAQAAEHFDVHIKTIFRWVKCGKLPAEKINGQWHVHISEHDAPQKEQNAQDNVQSLKTQLQRADSEIQHLREHFTRRDEHIESLTQEIDHLTQVVAMSQKNIGALTEQLDDSRQMIEDMRSRSWWKRIFRR